MKAHRFPFLKRTVITNNLDDFTRNNPSSPNSFHSQGTTGIAKQHFSIMSWLFKKRGSKPRMVC